MSPVIGTISMKAKKPKHHTMSGMALTAVARLHRRAVRVSTDESNRVVVNALRDLTFTIRPGERVALVSDAGTPAVSDPGARIVDAVRDTFSGDLASAQVLWGVLASLILAGLGTLWGTSVFRKENA